MAMVKTEKKIRYGKLRWIPKKGKEVIIDSGPFIKLNAIRTRLWLDPFYSKANGELKLTY